MCRLLQSLGILFRVAILDFVQTDSVNSPDAKNGFALPLNADNGSAQLQQLVIVDLNCHSERFAVGCVNTIEVVSFKLVNSSHNTLLHCFLVV